MKDEDRELIFDILGQAHDITVATLRPDGWPQATTVSFVSDGFALYFGTWAHSQKAANIAADPRVSVTVNAPYAAWSGIRSLSMSGEAVVVNDPAEMARIGELMLQRFGDELSAQTGMDLSQTVFVRITPRWVSILDYSKGFGFKTDLALEPGEAEPRRAA